MKLSLIAAFGRSIKLIFKITVLIIGLSSVSLAERPDEHSVTSIAEQTMQIFVQSCVGCHGSMTGTGAGGFDYIDDFPKLRSSVFINLNQPRESKLFQLIDSGYMPAKQNKLPQSEIDAVLAWITAGAPSVGQ